MALVEKKDRFEKYLAAINQHKLEETLEFYDPNYEATVDNKAAINGIDAIRSKWVKSFADPNYSCKLVEYLPSEGDDQIRVHLKTNDNKHYEATEVFSKGKPLKILRTSLTHISG